jgi:TonB family protein
MRALFLLSALLLSLPSVSQTTAPVPVTPPEAGQPHVIKHSPPDYPPIAKAAHVQGSVQLQVEVDPSGHVVATKTISGPPMLVGAAIECVRKWVYEPFDSASNPAVKITKVTINFSLDDGDDIKILLHYSPLASACSAAANSGAPTDEQAAACKKAADVADKFPKGRVAERRVAYIFASTAFRRNKAVVVVEQGHDDASGSGAAYACRAQAEGELNDMVSADRDLTRAEDFQRSVIDGMNKSDTASTQRNVVPVLKRMLTYHVKVLTALGNSAGADAKAAEAAKL